MTTYKARYTCPSNIAIVKYWGKFGNQLPRNASISFTLTNAVSDTEVSYSPRKGEGNNIQFLFQGKEKPSFLPKIENFFNNIEAFLPFIKEADFVISSDNSFPHSSGIASSASGMGAMAMCLCDIESQITGKPMDIQKVSTIARLGSGSACRSLYKHMAVWGKHDAYPSSNDYAVEFGDQLHSVFETYHDDILIVSDKEKSVSSTAGHGLMDTNVYATTRYQQAQDNMTKLKSILINGEVEDFGILAESEAMTLHALMMCSSPSFILIAPNTIEVINAIRNFRAETKLSVYFTLDAGPNVHILYPHSIRDKVSDFIKSDLLCFSPQKLLIEDKVGNGPLRIQ
jgi:diphosphomevalonate decarboxylase